MTTPLSSQQHAVLDAARRGLSLIETGAELYLTPATIKFHRSNLMARLNANSIAHAVALAFEQGIFHNRPSERDKV
jgi:DNA-binding NarL/FixJ family response regulator